LASKPARATGTASLRLEEPHLTIKKCYHEALAHCAGLLLADKAELRPEALRAALRDTTEGRRTDVAFL
jgi:hypothetical protein